MIDIKELRKGLNIDDEELVVICQNTGISRTRLAMAEHGLVNLKPEEESMLRMAINYALHCRQAQSLVKLGQGHFDNTVPMTWAEYQKQHQSSEIPRTMKLMTISVELQNIDGGTYFPLSEPIPWNIDLNSAVAKVLASQPELVNSMIRAIRTVVGLQGE